MHSIDAKDFANFLPSFFARNIEVFPINFGHELSDGLAKA